MLLHTVCNYHRAVLRISWLDYLLTWQMLVVKLWTLYCEIINNILFLLKNMSCITMSFRATFLTPKLDIPSIAPLPWPAAPYLQMILNLMSLASFWRRRKECFYLYRKDTLPHKVYRSSFLMSFVSMTSRITWSTKIPLWLVSSLKWK